MKYIITVDDKSKAGSVLVELAKIFSKIYKTIKIEKTSNNNLEQTKQANRLLSEIEQSLKEVKLMKEGKLPKKTLNELIEELKD